MDLLKHPARSLANWTNAHPLWTLLLGGLGAGTVFPPLLFWPGLFIGFSLCAAALTRSISLQQTFLRAWIFGFGINLVSLTWPVWALHVDWAEFWWVIPFAIVGPPALMAVTIGISAIPTFWVRGRPIWTVLVFGAAWGCVEYARFLVFPWNFLSTMLLCSEGLMQLFAWVQINVISTLLVWTGCAPFLVWALPGPKLRAWMTLKTLLFWGLIWALGTWRLGSAPEDLVQTRMVLVSETRDIVQGAISAGTPFIRIVQPAVPQAEKWHQDAAKGHVDQMIALSTLPLGELPKLLIWPESAITVFLSHQRLMRHYIAQALAPDAFLLTGGLRLDNSKKTPQIWNSLFLLDAQGDILDIYDKRHLLMFGEYLPARPFLERLPIAWGAFLQSSVDYTPGDNSPVRHLPVFGLLQASICYEIAFPEETGVRPSWILHSTNDGWFRRSFGPYQHLALARIRAIESGLPVVRGANTGISALIDPYGRILAALPLEQTGILDCTLPQAIPHKPSFLDLLVFGRSNTRGEADLDDKRRQLIAYLQEHPNHVEGWALLAQTYAVMGLEEEAQIAATRAEVLRVGTTAG